MMLEEIEKLKKEYDLKVADCDKLIEHLRKQIADCRKNNEDSSSLRIEAATERAKRQCYVQAKYDFDSLIDFI